MAPLKPLFKLTSLIALFGWLMLVCLPFWPYTDELVLGLSVVLLAIVYSCIGSLDTYSGVRSNGRAVYPPRRRHRRHQPLGTVALLCADANVRPTGPAGVSRLALGLGDGGLS